MCNYTNRNPWSGTLRGNHGRNWPNAFHDTRIMILPIQFISTEQQLKVPPVNPDQKRQLSVIFSRLRHDGVAAINGGVVAHNMYGQCING